MTWSDQRPLAEELPRANPRDLFPRRVTVGSPSAAMKLWRPRSPLAAQRAPMGRVTDVDMAATVDELVVVQSGKQVQRAQFSGAFLIRSAGGHPGAS